MRLLLKYMHCAYFFGGLFPRPPPDGLPVVLGPLTGLGFFAIINHLLFYIDELR